MGRFSSRVALLALIALLGTLALGAVGAQAATTMPVAPCYKQDDPWYGCNVRVSTLGYYKGWASVSAACYNPYILIARMPEAPRQAWKWTGSGWQESDLYPGARVYVWPFATAWSWVWTQSTGWLAMHDSDLVINRFCIYDSTAAAGGARWGG